MDWHCDFLTHHFLVKHRCSKYKRWSRTLKDYSKALRKNTIIPVLKNLDESG